MLRTGLAMLRRVRSFRNALVVGAGCGALLAACSDTGGPGGHDVAGGAGVPVVAGQGGNPSSSGAAGSLSGSGGGVSVAGSTTVGGGTGGTGMPTTMAGSQSVGGQAGASSLGGAGGVPSAAGGGSGAATGGAGGGGPPVAGSGTGGTVGAGGSSLGGGAGAGGLASGGVGGGAGGEGGKSCPYDGNITYTLARAANPTPTQQMAYELITAAMEKAIAYYNCYTDITKALNVQYEPSVATADGNINGSLRFGANTTYMDYRTAMHEIAHTVGIGQASNWNSFVVGGLFTGENANRQLQEINATLARPEYTEVHADRQHFWPYGLNQQSEAKSEADLINHCKMVMAICKDLGLK